jgi:hypothetical protein
MNPSGIFGMPILLPITKFIGESPEDRLDELKTNLAWLIWRRAIRGRTLSCCDRTRWKVAEQISRIFNLAARTPTTAILTGPLDVDRNPALMPAEPMLKVSGTFTVAASVQPRL